MAVGRGHSHNRKMRKMQSKLCATQFMCNDLVELRFWNEPTAYTPESRTEVHQYMADKRGEKAKSPEYGLTCVVCRVQYNKTP